MIPVELQTLVMDGTTLPPVITRKSGWPKTLRLRSRGKTTIENQPICGNCGKRGHNIRTCERSQRQIQAAASDPLPNAPLLPSHSAMEITQEDHDMIQADYEREQTEYKRFHRQRKMKLLNTMLN
jgi:hypothetical protein